LLVTSEAIINDQQSEIMWHDKDWWLYGWEKEWAKINDSNRQLWASYDNGAFALNIQVNMLAITQFVEGLYATHRMAVVPCLIAVMLVVLVLLISIYLYRNHSSKVSG